MNYLVLSAKVSTIMSVLARAAMHLIIFRICHKLIMNLNQSIYPRMYRVHVINHITRMIRYLLHGTNVNDNASARIAHIHYLNSLKRNNGGMVIPYSVDELNLARYERFSTYITYLAHANVTRKMKLTVRGREEAWQKKLLTIRIDGGMCRRNSLVISDLSSP